MAQPVRRALFTALLIVLAWTLAAGAFGSKAVAVESSEEAGTVTEAYVALTPTPTTSYQPTPTPTPTPSDAPPGASPTPTRPPSDFPPADEPIEFW